MGRNYCPCCGNSLLRHARQGGLYWFCTSCHQDMPILLANKLPQLKATMLNSHTIQIVNS